MSLDTPLDEEILKNLAESLAIILNNANMITCTEDDIYDALKNSRLTINSNDDDDDNNDDDNGDDQYHCERGLSPQVKNYDIASLDGSIDSDAPPKTSRAIYTTITADINLFDEEALVDTIAYSMALYRELHKNLGSIDHSKVKEYWLYRGPRIVLLWIMGIVLLILVHIYTLIHTYPHIYIYIYIRMCTHSFIYSFIYLYIHTQMHTNRYIYFMIKNLGYLVI